MFSLFTAVYGMAVTIPVFLPVII